MSLAGKILSVLLIPVVLGWIVLLAMATQLNKEWSAEIVKLDKQIDGGPPASPGAPPGGLKGDLIKLRADLDSFKTQIAQEQTRRDREIAVIRAELSDVQKVESHTKETLLRLQIQVARAQGDAKKSDEARDVRLAEKAATEKSLAEARSLVDQLKTAVGEQFDELGKLRQTFQETLADNQRRLKELRKGPGGNANSGQPKVRRTSRVGG